MGKLYNAECSEIEYRATMAWEGENIKIGFQPVPPQPIDINSCQVETGPVQPTSPKIEKPDLVLDQTLVLQILTLKLRWIDCLSNLILGKRPI